MSAGEGIHCFEYIIGILSDRFIKVDFNATFYQNIPTYSLRFFIFSKKWKVLKGIAAGSA